ncbi:striatin-interacting protein 1 [Adelges cooleyi]|uniref:striatin-interacting protein 1 n=1 Tax=Adelges cooleyi TaxID=133065 RepID=UPI00217FD25B|nr:striatin-interacting protein 1 [Adelges cooleyi]
MFFVMDGLNGKRATPKLKESMANRKQKQDSEEESDCPDLEYNYGDTDTHLSEMSELYSYSELDEYQYNIQEFEKMITSLNLNSSWLNLTFEDKHVFMSKLLDNLEVSDKTKRMNAARCVLYLTQGCWAECQSDKDQQLNTKENVLFLYKYGIYNIFIELLNIEIEPSAQIHRKSQINCTDSTNLRIIFNVLYTFIEVLRISEFEPGVEYKEFRENLLSDIGLPFTEDHIVVKLLGMITRFCSGMAPYYPMKKVLLVLWKLILVLLGGMESLERLKNEYRRNANLPELQEDQIEIIKSMRSSSPPPSSTDMMNAQKRGGTRQKRGLIKQSSLDESLVVMDLSYQNDEDLQDYEDQQMGMDDISSLKNIPDPGDYRPQTPPMPMETKGLPWIPKVRHKDLQFFLDQTRVKFLGFKLDNDVDTLIGLPEPIHESVAILKQYMYTSLADYQIKKEETIQKNPLTMGENEIDQTPAEILYQAMLPNLPQHMIALLKILLAASPTSKAKSDSINIIADILPVDMPMSFSESVKLETDINRQKEIVVKAISGILLLLLKHFKANHIYQFEFISQHLVFANCIPLVIKFLNQNLVSYVSSKNTIPILDFPNCVIGEGPDLSLDNIEVGEFPLCSWRNVYSCINLLRVLNKITKWKHSRIMMLVIFKSAPILKKSLKVRHAMMQLYILKLLKMQAKYLGRAWRKSNMKTMSTIYQKVRHRLNDDWAYGNDLEARPTDFQIEERFLRSAVDKFHARRYSQQYDDEFTPSDFSVNTTLGKPVKLSNEFQQHYEIWMNQEVFQNQIDWDALITHY